VCDQVIETESNWKRKRQPVMLVVANKDMDVIAHNSSRDCLSGSFISLDPDC
jgi:hypothetical protein